MIEGRVNAALEAIISLAIEGPSGRAWQVEAVVDTGYSGFLTLPLAMVEKFGLVYIGEGRAILADGGQAWFDVYDAVIVSDDYAIFVEVDAMGERPLAGMRLLEGHSLHVEVVEGGRVVIEART